ncbi:hypothetical protein SDC9_186322 [bioreactor metagenome]|uniref:Uncharacterized protein n=1 Tax=bioreactor metagenome TaxID=1076179 RepID=A0A645HIL2_9ZZZZ
MYPIKLLLFLQAKELTLQNAVTDNHAGNIGMILQMNHGADQILHGVADRDASGIADDKFPLLFQFLNLVRDAVADLRRSAGFLEIGWRQSIGNVDYRSREASGLNIGLHIGQNRNDAVRLTVGRIFRNLHRRDEGMMLGITTQKAR